MASAVVVSYQVFSLIQLRGKLYGIARQRTMHGTYICMYVHTYAYAHKIRMICIDLTTK
jgi:hypothetical protein